MNEDYLVFQVGKATTYVRKSCLSRLKNADAAIFDCDGVLIDTRESYRKCILETVKYFLRALACIEPPDDKILREATYRLKRSGGFNNDWDAAYALLLFLFSKTSASFQAEFISLTSAKQFEEKSVRARLDYVKTSLRHKPSGFSLDPDEIVTELLQFATRVDDSGTRSAERELEISVEMLSAVKRFLNYPDSVKESPLAIVFDEMFYGSKLFSDTHGVERQFYFGPGFVEIEKERTLVTCETVKELAMALGRENFGIVSGRDRLSAKFSLGCVLDMFAKKAVIFLMDVNYEEEEDEEKKRLRKPDPYCLIKASKGLEPFNYSLYVGDSAEDMIMVKRANEENPRFISVGVYSLSDFKEELVSYFLDMRTDVILYSIKELPFLLYKVKAQDL